MFLFLELEHVHMVISLIFLLEDVEAMVDFVNQEDTGQEVDVLETLEAVDQAGSLILSQEDVQEELLELLVVTVEYGTLIVEHVQDLLLE